MFSTWFIVTCSLTCAARVLYTYLELSSCKFLLERVLDPFVHFLYPSLPPRWWAESFISSGVLSVFRFTWNKSLFMPNKWCVLFYWLLVCLDIPGELVRMNNPAGILAATWTDKILIMLIGNWTTKIRLFFLNCFQKYCIAFESLSNNSFTCKSCIFTCKLLHLTMRKIISIKPCCQTLDHGENLNLTLPVQIPHPGEGGSEVLKWSASRGEESLINHVNREKWNEHSLFSNCFCSSPAGLKLNAIRPQNWILKIKGSHVLVQSQSKL